jgi:hypothetical protein
MKRLIPLVIAGSVLAVPAGADAAVISTARAEQAAKQVVAPLQAQSVACFRATFDPRRPRIERHACIVRVPSPAGENCIVTVAVTAKKRPRRVSAKVSIPLRCVPIPPPLGSRDSL